MKNLRKLLPGGKREPKILVVFANRQEDCDRLIRYLSRRVTNSPHNTYPIHAYCLEKPYEAHRCAHVVVDPDQRRLYKRAQEELTSSWVALSATSWNNLGRGTLLKLIPLTLPPFRGIVGNENGDVFNLKLFPITRHMIDRVRQWYHRTTAEIGHWTELHFSWPLRHGTRWLRRKVKDKIVWGTAVGLGRMAWFAKHGVPGLYTKSMTLEASRKFDQTNYHKPSDQYDPNWNMEGAIQDGDLFYQVALRVANADKWPEWKPGVEFKAIRERSLAK